MTVALASLAAIVAAALAATRRERHRRERIVERIYSVIGETHLERRLRRYVSPI